MYNTSTEWIIFILYRAAVKKKIPNWIQKSLSVGQGN